MLSSEDAVAERLKVNEETVRRLFANEPDVVVICFPKRGRRVYLRLEGPYDRGIEP